jgi:hypothetical protein
MIIIGIDPGTTTGVYRLETCHPLLGYGAQLPPLDVAKWVATQVQGVPRREIIIAMERFVIGPRAARSNYRQGQVDALQVIGAIRENFAGVVVLREMLAGIAKTWATDRRLRASGLLDGLAGQRHARDALRHALYAAVSGGHARDPLSVKR